MLIPNPFCFQKSMDGDSSKETYNLSNLNCQIFIANVALSDGTLLSKKAVKK
jgi:hypothetical protein